MDNVNCQDNHSSGHQASVISLSLPLFPSTRTKGIQNVLFTPRTIDKEYFQQLIKYFSGNTCSLIVYLQNLEVIHRPRNERLNVKVDQRRISISRGNDRLICKIIITTQSDQLT